MNRNRFVDIWELEEHLGTNSNLLSTFDSESKSINLEILTDESSNGILDASDIKDDEIEG